MFSSRNFIVFSLTFRTLIHFEFIFACSIRECSNFILLYGKAVQSSQNHLLKRHCLFFNVCLCHSCGTKQTFFQKKIYKWPTGIWKDAKQYPSSGKCKSKPEWDHLTPVRMARVKKHAKFWWGCGEKGIVMHCWLVQPLWKIIWRVFKNCKTELWSIKSYLWVYCQNKGNHYLKEISAPPPPPPPSYVPCSLASNSQDMEIKCPQIDEWIKQMWYIHTPESYLPLKRRRFCLFNNMDISRRYYVKWEKSEEDK